MKRIICLCLVIVCLFVLCGCKETSISEGASVTLNFCCYDNDITQQLTAEEAARVVEILDGNTYDPLFAGVPSCGFDEGVSLKVNGRVYAIAMDTCNTVLDCGALKYFSISEDGIDYIHALFEKYGGYFPCV